MQRGGGGGGGGGGQGEVGREEGFAGDSILRFMASSRWPAPLCKSNIPGGGIGKLNLLLRTSIVLERLHLQGRGAGDGESYCAYCCVTVIQVACGDITKRRKKKKTVERQTFENGARKNQNKDGGCGRLASSARRKKKKRRQSPASRNSSSSAPSPWRRSPDGPAPPSARLWLLVGENLMKELSNMAVLSVHTILVLVSALVILSQAYNQCQYQLHGQCERSGALALLRPATGR